MGIILFIALLNGMLFAPYFEWDVERWIVQPTHLYLVDTGSIQEKQTGIPYYCDGVFVRYMEI